MALFNIIFVFRCSNFTPLNLEYSFWSDYTLAIPGKGYAKPQDMTVNGIF